MNQIFVVVPQLVSVKPVIQKLIKFYDASRNADISFGDKLKNSECREITKKYWYLGSEKIHNLEELRGMKCPEFVDEKFEGPKLKSRCREIAKKKY